MLLALCLVSCTKRMLGRHLSAMSWECMQVQRKLILALVLALCFMVVEVVGGIMANR